MTPKEDSVSTEARRGTQWHGAAALLIGLVLFLAIRGGKILRPGYTDWLMAGDPATHWLGWQFFRHSPGWQWPLGANAAYGMEIGSSVVFTDSIPLLALIFKPFSAWLPDNFQYLGLWLLSCLCLQSFFAFKLLCRFTADKRLALVCSVFFTIAPPCLFRIVQGHFALVAHWLLLAGLWLYFAKQFSSRRWLALLLLTTLIHAYILAMVWAIWAADLLQRRLLRQAATRAVVTHLLVANVCIVLVMWAAGYFMLGSEVGLVGFGLYRLNLVTLFDPDVIWSLLLRNQPTGPGDYEGFAFMGVGMLLLAAVAAAELLRHRQMSLRPGLWPLLAAMAALVVISVSPSIAFGSFNLYQYHVPHWLEPLANAFRVSGRFFWPVYYVLFIGIFCVVLRRFQGKAAMALCGLLLLAQIVDSTEAWRTLKAKNGRSPVWVSPLASPAWQDFAQRYKKVVVVQVQNVAPNWWPLSHFAATHRMAINTGYFARVDEKAAEASRMRLAKVVDENRFEADALYVFENDERWQRALAQLRPSDAAGVVDGIRVLAPGLKACGTCKAGNEISGR